MRKRNKWVAVASYNNVFIMVSAISDYFARNRTDCKVEIRIWNVRHFGACFPCPQLDQAAGGTLNMTVFRRVVE